MGLALDGAFEDEDDVWGGGCFCFFDLALDAAVDENFELAARGGCIRLCGLVVDGFVEEDEAGARGGCVRLFGLTVDGAVDEEEELDVAAAPTEGSWLSVWYGSAPNVGPPTATGNDRGSTAFAWCARRGSRLLDV